MAAIEIDVHFPVLCSTYHTMRPWHENVWRDVMRNSWVTPMHQLRQICGSRIAMTQPSWLHNVGHNSATSLADKSGRYEWFETASDLINVWARGEVILIDAIDRWRRPLYAFIRARQKLVKTLITATSCAGGRTICPRPLQVDLLTLKVVPESSVTWATSVPILVFLGLCSRLRPDVRDR